MKKTYCILAGLISFIFISASFTTFSPPGFKNLKILSRFTTEKQMDSIMNHFAVSLGVQCDFCHVHNTKKDTWDMASDANAGKLIARKMMLMTNGINAKYFAAEKGAKQAVIQAITCYTCHHGEAIPATSPVEKESSK